MKLPASIRLMALPTFGALLGGTHCEALDTSTILPASTRQALVSKSKHINPDNYVKQTWSNRAATPLTPVSATVYTGDRPFYWNGIDVSCRMAVIEIPSKTSDKPDLLVHSPVRLDAQLKEVVDSIGTVKYVMSSNYEHLAFVSEWYLAYPDAAFWGCPGLAERRPDIKWAGEIPFKYRPAGWKGGDGTYVQDSSRLWDLDMIQALHIDCEKNPFTGKSFFNEVIFYHKSSKTLIITDLFYNYPKDGLPNSQYGRDDSWELAPKVGQNSVFQLLVGTLRHEHYLLLLLQCLYDHGSCNI